MLFHKFCHLIPHRSVSVRVRENAAPFLDEKKQRGDTMGVGPIKEMLRDIPWRKRR